MTATGGALRRPASLALAPILAAALLAALAVQALLASGGAPAPMRALLPLPGLVALVGAFTGRGALLRWGARGAGLLAALVPLAFLPAEPLPQLAARLPVWPQILVLLLAGRVLSLNAEERFRFFWNAPLREGSTPRTQSTAAALCLGAALTLLFYSLVGRWAPGAALDPVGVTLRAFAGPTYVHAAIIALFFVLLAALLDAALAHLTDRTLLSVARRRLATGGPAPRLSPAEIAGVVRTLPGRPAESRTSAYLLEACALPGARAERETLEGFHTASRRFLRALLAFLPLLGFVGTVIGLAVAIGSLGTNGPDATAVDIGSSLAGLSIQFETTLLGLATGLVASLLMAILERREAELRQECRRLVEVLVRADG
ncbi:MotA/TolQ/ExbB proton channel family protein [Aureimonas sp. AU4]|uniref:MotA/TolQ/ExbB proton channel family protein n=1 Tax=Aureimonas sp. AU4 TaxID=1638163 RepID=UPI0007843C30|nr:MotA/TolQ/ExbB proton channel family protein [Aureimonas sp. AU4]